MKGFAGAGLQRLLADLVDAPVLLDSDANASLLGILTEDATLGNAALFSLSSILNLASCTGHELVRGRTPAFGDVGVLFSGVDNERLDGMLSTNGLLRFARGRGLQLERIEDLWLQPHEEESRADVLDAFATALATAVSAVAVTMDPETVFLVGRLQPLVDEVLPDVRRRLDDSLASAPAVKAPTQDLGLSVARGAVHACLRVARNRLRTAVLEARRQSRPVEQAVPAF
jgi:predicted NBD/HSP70 family sugar kinase